MTHTNKCKNPHGLFVDSGATSLMAGVSLSAAIESFFESLFTLIVVAVQCVADFAILMNIEFVVQLSLLTEKSFYCHYWTNWWLLQLSLKLIRNLYFDLMSVMFFVVYTNYFPFVVTLDRIFLNSFGFPALNVLY